MYHRDILYYHHFIFSFSIFIPISFYLKSFLLFCLCTLLLECDFQPTISQFLPTYYDDCDGDNYYKLVNIYTSLAD